MQKRIMVFVLMVSCLILFPNIVNALGLEGIGGRVSLVMPDGPADNSIGLGVVGDLGSVVPGIPELKAEASVDYWGDSYDVTYYEWSWSSITFGATGKYHFPVVGVNFSPFAGGGMGLTMSRSSAEWKGVSSLVDIKTETSDTEIDIGLHFVGGVDMPVGSNLKFTGQVKYHVNGVDTIEISGGLLVKLY